MLRSNQETVSAPDGPCISTDEAVHYQCVPVTVSAQAIGTNGTR